MKRNVMWLFAQILAGGSIAMVQTFAGDPSGRLIVLLLSLAAVVLYGAAIALGRRDAAAEARGSATVAKGHTVATASLRGCYEIVLQVNGSSTKEDLGDDTHLLHGENFNLLVKRVEGTITGTLEDGRTLEVNMKREHKGGDTVSKDTVSKDKAN